MSPLHPQKKIIFNANISIASDPYTVGLSLPAVDDLSDSELSDSLDDSMEIAPEDNLMERYDLKFNFNQDHIQY